MFVLLFLGLVGFAFHLFSYKLRIVYLYENVNDRPSLQRARHGLKKKKLFSSPTLFCTNNHHAVCKEYQT